MTGGAHGSSSSRRLWAFALALTGLAVAIRLYHLGTESLWLDEAATWWNATRPTWHDTIFAEGNHSPLWWIVTRLFVGALGDSEFALRLPAALLGAISVALVWLLSRALLDSRAGLDAAAPPGIALLAAIHPFWIEYAQEARMYSALLAETLGLSLLLLAWIERPRRALLVAYGLLATVAFYTHVFAGLTVASHATYILIERLRGRRVPVIPVLLAQLAAAVLYLPWALRSATKHVAVATQGNFTGGERAVFALWRLLYGPSLATADRARIDGGLTAFVREEWIVFMIGALLCVLLLALGARALRRQPSVLIFVSTSILVPFAILLVGYSRLPLLHEKYLIMTAPFLLLTVVVGARSAPGAARRLLPGALAVWIGIGALAYLAPGTPGIDRWIVHGHPRGKEQWADARRWVAERAEPGTIVVLYPSFLEKPWAYYDRGRLPARGLAESEGQEDSSAEPPAWASAHKVLLVSASVRGDERERVAGRIARWMATDSTSTTPGGVTAQELFPRQWGVWTYAFLRGHPPVHLPN